MNLAPAEKLVKYFEGLRLHAYLCPAGKWTLGYGQTKGIKKGMVWTREQAENDVSATVRRFAEEVRQLVRKDTSDRELCALTSLAYNIGTPNFKTSSALRWHNAKESPAKVCAGIRMWNKATVNGKKIILKGLVRRREAECSVYTTGDFNE